MASTPRDLFGPSKAWLTDIYRKRLTFMMVCAHPSRFRRDFLNWLSRNYQVWLAFEHEADRVWARGFRHYGARTIGEWLRHETLVRERDAGDDFKLNDHYWPDLARLYVLMHPDRGGFFEFRLNPLSVRGA